MQCTLAPCLLAQLPLGMTWVLGITSSASANSATAICSLWVLVVGVVVWFGLVWFGVGVVGDRAFDMT